MSIDDVSLTDMGPVVPQPWARPPAVWTEMMLDVDALPARELMDELLKEWRQMASRLDETADNAGSRCQGAEREVWRRIEELSAGRAAELKAGLWEPSSELRASTPSADETEGKVTR